MTSSPVFLQMMKRRLPVDGSSIPVKSMLALRIGSDVQPSESEGSEEVRWRDCRVGWARCLTQCSGEGCSGSVMF